MKRWGSVLAVIGVLLVSGVARADWPVVTWATSNPATTVMTQGPLSRTWSWTCDDPGDHFPLELRCQVYDVTAGALDSGKEVKLSDKVCATASKDPVKVTHTYTVPSPQKDHRYMYVARCLDAKKYETTGTALFWYDLTPPTSKIHSGPPKKSAAPQVTFVFSCDDNSFGYKTAPPIFSAACDNYTKVIDVDSGALAKPLSMSGQSTSSGQKITLNYTFVSPGNYRFETYAKDQAGNKGQVQLWTWGVSGPDGGPPDAAVLFDAGPTADMAKPDTLQASDTASGGPDSAPQDMAGEAKDHPMDRGAMDQSAGDNSGSGTDSGQTDSGGQGHLDGSDTGCDCRTSEHGGPTTPTGHGLLLLGLLLLLWRRNSGAY